MSASHTCFTLYPSGTLGRIFIDIAIEAIISIQPYSVNYSFDQLCIQQPNLFVNAIDSLVNNFKKQLKYSTFPLTGNDARSLKNKIISLNRNDPSTIISYMTNLIISGGFNRLNDTITTPMIMRVELYEYAKKGYVDFLKESKYPYKQASIMDLGLAALGSMITHVAMTKIGDDLRYYYFLPIKPINLSTIQSLKNILANSLTIYSNQGTSLGVIISYKIAGHMCRKVNVDTTVGEILSVRVLGNRYSLANKELVNTGGWIWLMNKVHQRGLKILNLIVRVIDHTMKKTNYKSLSPLYEVLDELYRYVQCDESALYRAVRLLYMAVDAFRRIEEGRSVSEDWRNVYEILKTIKGVKRPGKMMRALAEDLGSLATQTPCLERLILI